ncbi:MAG: hypothetical protein SFU56_07615 [Capsulimonadales bacterium]|nr:hypothetical protein [Capsulimonadales bacterium]
MMQISLLEFLRYGRTAGLHANLSKDDVEAILGSPNGTGGETRRRKNPSIYKYESLEIMFAEPERQNAHRLTINPYPDDFMFPPSWTIDDWSLHPTDSVEDVQRFLEDNNLSYEFRYPELSNKVLGVVESSVEIYFDDGLLCSITSLLK